MPGKRRILDADAADRETAMQLGEGWRPQLWHRVVVQHVIDALAIARDSDEVSAASVAVAYLAILVELPPLSPSAPVSIARVMARAGLSRRTVAAAFAILENAGAIISERQDGKPIVVRMPHFEASMGGAATAPTRSEVAQLQHPPVVVPSSGGAATAAGVGSVAAPPNFDRIPNQVAPHSKVASDPRQPVTTPHRERDLKHAFEVSSEEQEPDPDPSMPDRANPPGVHPIVSQMLIHLGVRGSTLSRFAVAVGNVPQLLPVDVAPWIEAGKARGISNPDEWEKWISSALIRRMTSPFQSRKP